MILRDKDAILIHSIFREMCQSSSYFAHFVTLKRLLLLLRNVFVQ